MMPFLKQSSDFFGLDIGSTAIRLVQLSGKDTPKTLVKYAFVPIEGNISISDSKADLEKLSAAIKQLVAQAKLNTRNVAVGIPSGKVFTLLTDVDRLPPTEMTEAINLQADSLIPTLVAESKIDWALIGDSPVDKTKQEILLSSVPNAFIEARLDMLEAIGLNVIAFEPDNLAVARALTPVGATSPELLIDVGNKSTDLVIVMHGNPTLTRSIPTGTDAIVKAAMQNLNIDQKQAEQFVYKFGLGKDKLDGQVYQAISNAVDILTSEIDKSIKFFQARYHAVKIDRLIVTGGASVIPEFPLYLANKFGLNVEIGNAWRNVAFAPDRKNELLSISNQFSVAVGLAERVL
jgi:type IV pilus assembly protein PilM